mmetsp:Transcript_169636/g.538609  ORF Transcript_169636/g.538609 Transcript_169636/m.538609 type:complete len:123 (-) Transcript_169636:69-437(-)
MHGSSVYISSSLLLGVWICSEAGNVCRGTQHVSEEIWETAKDVDLLARFAHVPLFMVKSLVDAFFNLQEGHALEDAIQDCSAGVAAMVLHSLPEVERRMGFRVASKFYSMYEAFSYLPTATI